METEDCKELHRETVQSEPATFSSGIESNSYDDYHLAAHESSYEYN